MSDTQEATGLALSVVVPCHNEIESLPLLLPRLHDVCRSLTDSYEIILVDDGSTDGSGPAIDHIVQDYPHIIGVHLARRYGKQIALSAGLSQCQGDKVLLIDADLQDPPELLPDMIHLMEAGADVVYGVREHRESESAMKDFATHCFYRLMKGSGDEALPVDAGDFRLINRRVLDILQKMPERQRFLRGMMAWMGLKQVALPYVRHERPMGAKKQSFVRMAQMAMDALTSFSVMPLRLSLYLSLLCGALSTVGLVYVLLAWLCNDTVPGWTSLSCMMLFFFGLQFLCIGLIGEYVGRIYLEGKQRPLFLIESISKREKA